MKNKKNMSYKADLKIDGGSLIKTYEGFKVFEKHEEFLDLKRPVYMPNNHYAFLSESSNYLMPASVESASCMYVFPEK